MTSAFDPFAVLGVPPRLAQDAADLERRYLALNRERHPDRVGSSDSEALARAADVNAAYRAVRDPRARAKAWLDLRGLRLETARSAAPSAAALRGFELQEAAVAASSGDADAAATVRALGEAAARDLADATERLEAAAREEPEGVLGAEHPYVARIAALTAELNYLARQVAQAAAVAEDA